MFAFFAYQIRTNTYYSTSLLAEMAFFSFFCVWSCQDRLYSFYDGKYLLIQRLCINRCSKTSRTIVECLLIAIKWQLKASTKKKIPNKHRHLTPDANRNHRPSIMFCVNANGNMPKCAQSTTLLMAYRLKSCQLFTILFVR